MSVVHDSAAPVAHSVTALDTSVVCMTGLGARLSFFHASPVPHPVALDIWSVLPRSLCQSRPPRMPLCRRQPIDARISTATSLHLAALFNPDLAVATLLLEWQADIVAEGGSHKTKNWTYVRIPLNSTGAFNPDPAATALLLEWTQSPTSPSVAAAFNPHKAVVIAVAAFNPNPAVAALLLDRGSDVNATASDGRTPLHDAASGNPNPVMTAPLLDRGADIEAVSRRDGTPLLHAIGGNTLEIVKLLLDRGADAKVQGNDGNTPCRVARDKGYFAYTPLLIRLCRP